MNRSQQTVDQAESLFRTAIEAGGAVPYLMRFGDVPENDSYDFIGEGIEVLVGVAPRDLDHHAWVNLMQEVVPSDPDFPGGLKEMGRRFRAGEIPHYRADVRVRLADGTEKWLRDASVLVTDQSTGQTIGTLGTLRDITACKGTHE